MNRCLTGKFWNTLLMLLYLNVFYFPTLKRMNEEHNKMKEVTVWFIKIVCYHEVYVPSLLRLSNDIETNPGFSVYEIVNPVRLYLLISAKDVMLDLDKMLESNVLQCH